MYLVVECLVAFFSISSFLLVCLCSILVTERKRRGELVRTCIFCVVHSNLFCHLFHHFCFPLGEGHGSQDSEVRGKTDEDKWKVETKVVNIKMLMVL